MKFRRPNCIRGARGGATRAAEGDVIAKLEMITEEFDSITEQVNELAEE